MVTGVTGIKRVRQHYTVASAHCAQWLSLPSAELDLMIRVSASANFRGRAVLVSPGISIFLADLGPQADTSAVGVRTSLAAAAAVDGHAWRRGPRHFTA